MMGGMKLLSVATAAGSDHENSTDEGALFTQTFPANYWTVGKVVVMHVGAIVSDNNSTDTAIMRVRFGAAALTGTIIGASAAVDSEDGDVHCAQVTLVCRSIGTAGSFVAMAQMNDADATGTVAVDGYGPVVISSINTTAATYLSYNADWSVAHADNEVACELAVVWESA